MKKLKLALLIPGWMVAIAGLLLMSRRITHSSLFLIHSLDIHHSSSQPLLDDRTLLEVIQLPLDKISLFDLDLREIQLRILKSPSVCEWIQQVQIQKQFPNQVRFLVTDRSAKALFQEKTGALSYIDESGKLFGRLKLHHALDLPLFSGFKSNSQEMLRKALRVLTEWKKSPISQRLVLSGLDWHPQRGVRILIMDPRENQGPLRTWIDLGDLMDHGISQGNQVVKSQDLGLQERFAQLEPVLDYLSGNQIAVRYILANMEKKVVVKTDQGS